MPPDMDVSMRHTKLKPEEAALLAGEISKPSWESRNEGIHERVSFEDSIWGFDLAGGSFYKTPLRVTYVKPDSRASKAGIRPGDKLLKINDIDTSTLTIQQAHDIIISSGIYLKLSVTSPEDVEDAYYCYEDPLVEDGYDSEEERRLEEEKAAKRRVHAKVSSYWSLQWPWVSKRRLIYRESNCFMVNSKYEEARREKYPPLPVLRYTDDILLYQRDGDKEKVSDDNKKKTPTLKQLKESNRKSRQQKVLNGDVEKEATPTDDEQPNDVSEDEQIKNQISPIIEENDQEEVIENHNSEKPLIEELEENGDVNINNIESIVNDINEENSNKPEVLSPKENIEETIPDTIEENRLNGEVEPETSEDDILNEMLAKSDDNAPVNDEDNILTSILSDDGQNLENSEVNNER